MTDIDRQFYPKMVIFGLFMYGARFYNKSNCLFVNKFISLIKTDIDQYKYAALLVSIIRIIDMNNSSY